MTHVKNKSNLSPSKESKSLGLISQRYGVWDFWTVQQPRFDLQRRLEDVVLGYRLFVRLSREIFAIAPGMLIAFVLSKLWSGMETAVLMHLSSRLLQIIEVGVKEGHLNAPAVYSAIASRLSLLAFVAALQWWTDAAIPTLKRRIISHYEMYLMQARLRLDLITSQEPNSHGQVSADEAWSAFDNAVQFFASVLTSASQLTVIIHTSRANGGPVFAFLCMIKPVLHTVTYQNLWSQSFLANLNNPHYKRMKALKSFTEDSYRQDYISGNLGDHIISEYGKAEKKLGDTCTDQVWEQYDKRPTPFFDVFISILGDLPMVYCAINAVIDPKTFSLATIAVLQQSATNLRYSAHYILYTSKSFQRQCATLKSMYALTEIKNKLQEGILSYPGSGGGNPKGMGFDLCNVIFNYPGSKNNTSALNNISLSIKPGQLAVIVGANGSGKSTIIKLLTRLYDASSGEILIDGIPAQQYRASELRQATATFTQDHQLYPLSLYENIALGNPLMVSDVEKVQEAAELGGAADFIAKLEDGMATVMDPMNSLFEMNVPDDPEHPLQQQRLKLHRRQDLSGGERQRLVASRTFMHLNSGQVKFVAVDEPSSALDPEAEQKLFERLIAGREGKTMVFVTHRFGHLTKHADLIICMKDGVVAELGTHDDLKAHGGEYAKLFNIQANAFTSETEQ